MAAEDGVGIEDGVGHVGDAVIGHIDHGLAVHAVSQSLTHQRIGQGAFLVGVHDEVAAVGGGGEVGVVVGVGADAGPGGGGDGDEVQVAGLEGDGGGVVVQKDLIVDSLDVAVETVALKDTVEKRDTVAFKDTLRHFAGQAEIKGVIKDILNK